MDNTIIPTGGSVCPDCQHVVRVRTADGMLYWHRDTARKDGDQEAPWCWGGGMRWDGLARLGPIEAPQTPIPEWARGGVVREFRGKPLPRVNPRLTKVHMWTGPTCHTVQLPVGFIDAAPDGEQLGSYAWLAKVTQQLRGFVGSVTAAYRIAKTLHQARWPEGTLELPAGTLVRRRLEREKEA
jgi:hypothetical protein